MKIHYSHGARTKLALCSFVSSLIDSSPLLFLSFQFSLVSYWLVDDGVIVNVFFCYREIQDASASLVYAIGRSHPRNQTRFIWLLIPAHACFTRNATTSIVDSLLTHEPDWRKQKILL